MNTLDTVSKVQLVTALELALSVALSWIHDELDGTDELDLALEELEPALLILQQAHPNSKLFR